MAEEKDREGLPALDIETALVRYVAIRDEMSYLKDEQNHLREFILHWAETNDAKSYRSKQGPRFVRQEDKLRVSYKKAQEEKVLEWIDSTGNGGAFPRRVEKKTLGSILKQMHERNDPIPTDLFKLFWDPSVTIYSK